MFAMHKLSNPTIPGDEQLPLLILRDDADVHFRRFGGCCSL
jgi:hypothetical protein